MNLIKYFWIAIIGLLLTNSLCAYELSDLKTEVVSAISLEKNSFTPTENIKGAFFITNTGRASIIGGTAVIQLEKDGFIVDEFVSKNHWIIPATEKEIKFEFQPQNSGNYIVRGFFWNNYSEAVGNSSTNQGGAFKEFSVIGNNIQKPRILKIINKELIESNPNSKTNVKFEVQNTSTNSYQNLTVKIYLCKWASVFCENTPIKEEKININANKTQEFESSFATPKEAGYYEVKIVLTENNKIISIAKSRLKVIGENIQPRKLELFVEEDYPINSKLFVIGLGENTSTSKISIITKNNSNVVETIELPEQSLKFGEINAIQFSLQKEFNEICVKTSQMSSENCFYAPLKELISSRIEWKNKFNPQVVKVEAIYEPLEESLIIALEKQKINCLITIMSPSSQELYSEFIFGSERIIKKYEVKRDLGSVQIIIDDLDAKRQQVIELKTHEEEYSLNQKCLGKICTQGFVCNEQTIESSNGVCCIGECIPSAQTTKNYIEEPVPLIFWFALIIFLVSIIIAINAFKELRRK